MTVSGMSGPGRLGHPVQNGIVVQRQRVSVCIGAFQANLSRYSLFKWLTGVSTGSHARFAR